MTHKHLAAFLSIALVFSSTVQAAEVTRAAKIKKAATTFLTGAGTSLLLNAAAYTGAAALFSHNNPYYLGTLCLAAAATTGLVGHKIAEMAKGDELTPKEGVQQNVADLFANIAGGAVMTSLATDPVARNLFFSVCAAKLAYVFWWIGQLPQTPGTGLEEQMPNTNDDNHHTTTIVQQAPQEIQVVVPAPKPVVAQPVTAETSNYPWMGGDKPNHHDAFMLLGN